jgi:hypothetical protein
MKTLAFFFVMLFGSLPLSSCAQRSPVDEIEKVAAEYARTLSLRGTVVFDPRSAYDKRGTRSRTPQEIHSLAKLLGATITADEGDYLVCPGKPGLCKMSGAEAIISINSPEVVGDTAYVVVRVLEPTAFPTLPINSREDRLLVVKAGGSWRFVKLVGGGSIN